LCHDGRFFVWFFMGELYLCKSAVTEGGISRKITFRIRETTSGVMSFVHLSLLLDQGEVMYFWGRKNPHFVLNGCPGMS